MFFSVCQNPGGAGIYCVVVHLHDWWSSIRTYRLDYFDPRKAQKLSMGKGEIKVRCDALA